MRKILLFFMICVGVFAFNQDPAILSGRLENGLKYYIKENKLPAKTAYFNLIIDSGSTDEAQDELGLAHFVEHMAFNGSRDFSKNDLIKKLESLGVSFGADLNAQTSFDKTIYMLTIDVNKQNLDDVFKVYNNWMDGVSFDKDELEKERGVIIEEDRQRNTPNFRLFKQQINELFENSVYVNRLPIGDMNIIKSVDTKKIKEFYQRLYQPRFMSFVAVGDFDKYEIEKLIKQNLSSAKNTNSYTHPNKTIPLKSGLNLYNYDSSEVGFNSIRINYADKFLPITNEASLKSYLTDSFIVGLVSMLYEQKSNLDGSALRMKFSRSDVQARQNIYNFSINVLSDDFDTALKDMLSVIKGVKEYGFNKSDFNAVKEKFIKFIKTKLAQSKTKKSQHIINEMILAINSDSVILSEDDYAKLSLKILDEMTLDEINARFRRILDLKDKRVGVFSQNNFKLDKAKFIKYENSVEPYKKHLKEQATPSFLDDESLTPKAIIDKKIDKKRQIYTYILENNASVVLKPVKTRKNFVAFAAVSKGGTSNLANPKQAEFAVKLSNQSGVSEFSNYELTKILSDKQIEYQKNIGSLSQGFYGSTTTEDLKALLKVINLEFNAPRLDEKVLERIKTKALDELIKQQNLPEYKFSTEFIKFFYKNNPRVNPLERDDITQLNINNLKKIIDDKFTNAASYSFIIVGDFEVDKVEPLLKRYIATIASKPFKEKYVDDGVRAIKGEHKFSRDYQTSQRSDVDIDMINENVKYSRENEIKAMALESVLKMALREKIREDNGETYGFGVSIDLSKDPYVRSSANISFTCSPKNVDKILSEIKAIINEMKKSGAISAKHLENFKKASIINIQKNHGQPDFWAKNIIQNQIYNEELFDLDKFKNMINSITNDDIKTAAKFYLDDKNRVISVNNPK